VLLAGLPARCLERRPAGIHAGRGFEIRMACHDFQPVTAPYADPDVYESNRHDDGLDRLRAS
jgi:hypothetical protein